MPLDIFIPYWGDPGYMKEAVNSVLQQDNGDWLLTVVDDAYPDDEIQTFMSEMSDPRIRYIRKPQNEGITENYRTCVSLATQDIMVILGCDDIMLPNYVDTILAAHAKFPDAAIIQPGVQVIDENSQLVETIADRVKQSVVKPKIDSTTALHGNRLATSLLHGDWLYWPSLAFRTQSLRSVDFRDGFPLIQDLAIVMDLVYAGNQLVVDPVVCFSYRRHASSASSAKIIEGVRFAGEREYFKVAAAQAKELGWKNAERAAKTRLTSRAHAITLLPQAIAARSGKALKTLLRHAFGV